MKILLYLPIILFSLILFNRNALSDTEVDETALRLFVQQQDTDSVEKEINRLKRNYPNWEVPKDLYDFMETEYNDSEIFDLIKNGKFKDAELKIEEIKKIRNNWEPSKNLLQYLEEEKLVSKYMAFLSNNDFSKIISIKDTSIYNCERIDFMWEVANAYFELKNIEESKSTYKDILKRCDEDINVVFVTLQKIYEKFSQEKIFVESYDSFKNKLSERQLEFFLKNKIYKIEDIKNIKYVKDEIYKYKNYNEALRIAYYFLNKKQYDIADTFFDLILDNSSEPNNKALEGKIYTLLGKQYFDQALSLIENDSSVSKDAVYKAILLSNSMNIKDKYISEIEEYDNKDYNMNLNIGLYYQDKKDYVNSDKWFSKALNQNIDENTFRVWASNKIENMGVNYNDIKLVYPQYQYVLSEFSNLYLNDLIDNEQYEECLKETENTKDLNSLEIRGWCLTYLERYTEASIVFEGILSNTNSDELYEKALYGYSLSLVEMGLINKAWKVAQDLTNLDYKDEVYRPYISYMAQKEFDNKNYWKTLELIEYTRSKWGTTPGLEILKAYSYMKLRIYQKAHEVAYSLKQEFDSEEVDVLLEDISNERHK